MNLKGKIIAADPDAFEKLYMATVKSVEVDRGGMPLFEAESGFIQGSGFTKSTMEETISDPIEWDETIYDVHGKEQV